MASVHTVGSTATTVRRNAGILSVVYHSTEVVRVDANGDITLNTGGWMTNTTKLRMNQASNQYGLGFQMYQKDHRWYVSSGHDEPDVEFGGGNGHEHVILSGR